MKLMSQRVLLSELQTAGIAGVAIRNYNWKSHHTYWLRWSVCSSQPFTKEKWRESISRCEDSNSLWEIQKREYYLIFPDWRREMSGQSVCLMVRRNSESSQLVTFREKKLERKSWRIWRSSQQEIEMSRLTVSCISTYLFDVISHFCQ